MIFLTVGTQFPFDRLVRAVDVAIDKGMVAKKVFAQIGRSSYKPRNFGYTEFLKKSTFDSYIEKAIGIISHAGMGTITIASDHMKPLLVMPRLAKYGEVVNDHQFAIARKFGDLGHILVACDESELSQKMLELEDFIPRKRVAQTVAVVERIKAFLEILQKTKLA